MTNEISDVCSQKGVLSGSKESWVLCPALTWADSLGLSITIFCKVHCVFGCFAQWGGKAGGRRKGSEGMWVSISQFIKRAWAFSQESLQAGTRFSHQHRSGVCALLEGKRLFLVFQALAQMGPSLLRPVSFSSSPLSHLSAISSHFSRSWAKMPFVILLTESSAKEKGDETA